ncbi:octanoyltransferase [Chromatiales bacterium (ex Bugula neritina AB1)]|nr:octanoyltransferase [Chromatiales bacterium (ex Bugula neritina AB1)]
MTESIIVRELGLQSYAPVIDKMHHFTDTRVQTTPDELWVLQHTPVYTLGQAGDSKHVLAAGSIPVVSSDRGGQVTYHGPGQLVIYTLLDLRRRDLGVRSLVELLENTVIELLGRYNIESGSRRDAPGVYVNGSKIAALGLRVRRGCAFHGVSLNVDMDLEPFQRINPCGYTDLAVTQMSDHGVSSGIARVGEELSALLVNNLHH